MMTDSCSGGWLWVFGVAEDEEDEEDEGIGGVGKAWMRALQTDRQTEQLEEKGEEDVLSDPLL